MDIAEYSIGEKTIQVSLKGSPELMFGNDEVLSTIESDLNYHQDWYKEGYHVYDFLSKEEYDHFLEGLTNSIKKILSSYVEDLDGFTLETYHKFVKTDELHYKVVSVTRDLYPADFNFPVETIIPKFEKLLGYNLTDVDGDDGKQLHIIIRINRPHSTDFNPPHKDIYEAWDKESRIPRFVNIWIPVCGVTEKSSLPIAPGSHLVNEKDVLRTFEGGVVEGNKYRVRSVKSWGGDSKLIRAKVGYGQVLMFTPHLVHGLALNEQDDQTRVALEYRLFKRD